MRAAVLHGPGDLRVEESDMLLAPDLATCRLFPWGDPEHRVARLISDVTRADGSPFDGLAVDGAVRTVLLRGRRVG